MHVPKQNVRNEIKTKTRKIRNGDGWMDGKILRFLNKYYVG